MAGIVGAARPRWTDVAGYACAPAWPLTYVLCRGAMELPLPAWQRVALAVLPAVPAAGLVWLLVAKVRGMDELHRRVHLEALVVAFPLTLLGLMTLGLLQLAVTLGPADWSFRHVWPFLPCFYLLGLVVAWRRYQ